MQTNKIISKVLSRAYRFQGIAFYDLFDFEKSIESYNLSMEIVKKLGGDKNQEARLLNNIGNAYDGLGKFFEGLENHLMSLKIKRIIYPEVHSEIAISLNNIGNSYHYLEQYEKALEYFDQALAQRIKLFGYNHWRIASVLNNIGNVYYDIGEFEKSKNAHIKALRIRQQLFNNSHAILIYSYSNLARTYDALNKPDSAQRLFQLAISNHKKNYDAPTDMLAAVYQNLGVILQNNESYLEAEFYMNKALKHWADNHITKHPRVGSVLYALGQLNLHQANYQGANSFFQKALIALVEDFESKNLSSNPSSDLVLDPGELIKVFVGKSSSIYKQYKQVSSSENGLFAEQLLSTLKSSDLYIQKFRKSIPRRSDLQHLGEQSILIYQMLTDLYYERLMLTSKESYLDSIFIAMEKSKSNVLFQRLMDHQAKIESSIPDTLLLRQHDLLATINRYSSIGENVKLYEAKEEYDQLLTSIENEFPNYFELKYNFKFPMVKEIQNQLKRNEVLIEYQIVDSLLFTFYIAKDNSDLFKSVLPKDFSELVGGYLNYLSNPSQLRNEEVEKITEDLSSILLKNILKEIAQEIDHLIIIPDGIIGLIPFETLHGTNPSNFMLKNFSIQYDYSARTLSYKYEKPDLPAKKKYIGFAPEYETTSNPGYFPTFESNLKPLMWNRTEVEFISQFIGGDKYLNGTATESNFLNHGRDYRILHLDTHAIIEQDNPIYSRLFFDTLGDTIHDGILHAHEIYNLNLPADLVILSACNTGSGTHKSGEGIISLAHAFRYSGASSIVMSHWPVDDNSTYQLMSRFFEFLSNGYSKSQALQKAKLKFIEDTEPERLHPFYWASFNVVGSNDSVSISKNKWTPIQIILLLSIALGIWQIRKRTPRRSGNST